MNRTVVAIFEDDPVNRFIYNRMLSQKEEKIDFHIFDNPDKGLEKSKDTKFDIVFIEMHFWKRFGGIDILHKLKENSSHPLIAVAMTSLLQPGDLEYATSSGFQMCIEKPVTFESILPR